MNVVLTKPDQKYIEDYGKQILTEIAKYRGLTGKRWHPFNYDLGYSDIEEWHNALLEELKTLENNTTKG